MDNINVDNLSYLIDKSLYDTGTSQVYASIVNEIQKIVITKALEESNGNQVQAAKMLGMHRNSLSNKIKKFNIDVGGFKK